MSWYDDFIEEPIRDTVRLLRDNGFNTTCSCGHDMEIECDVCPDGEFKRLHDLLYNQGYRNYLVTFTATCVGDCVYLNISIKLNHRC